MKIKYFLVFSLVLNLMCFAGGSAFAYKKFFAKPVTAVGTPLYSDKISIYNELPINESSIVFIGDSLSEGNEWAEMFNDKSVKNRGIVGDTTEGLLLRIDSIIETKPKKIFLLYGTNDLNLNVSTEKIVLNFFKVLESIKTKSPETSVFIQSVLPINTSLANVNQTNEEILDLNNKLKSLAHDQGVKFIDLHTSFVKSGELNQNFTHDGLHLNGEGYLVWKREIGQYLKN